MALYIPHNIFHLARFLYVRPETFGSYYVHLQFMLADVQGLISFTTLFYIGNIITPLHANDERLRMKTIVHIKYCNVKEMIYNFLVSNKMQNRWNRSSVNAYKKSSLLANYRNSNGLCYRV
jgi:hypothetical protein